MRSIMIALSADGHFVARANIGLFYTKDGRPVSTGLPKGFSDLFGMTSCGLFFVIEVKTETGRLSPEQQAFLAAMEKRSAIAFVARSADQAVQEMRDRASAARIQRQQEWGCQVVV